MTGETGDQRSGIIAAVRTPLGLAALLVLVVEAVLIPVAARAGGRDRTVLVVGLIAVLAIVLVPLVRLAWHDPGLFLGSRAREEPDVAEPRYDVFISAPMAAFGDDAKAYQRNRADVLRLIKALRETANVRTVFYAGESLPSRRSFETADLSLDADLAALRDSRVFVLVYPAALPTSALIELGVAIGLRKPVVVHVLEGVDLPFLLRHAEGATDAHAPIHIYRYANFSEILQIHRTNPGLLERPVVSRA